MSIIEIFLNCGFGESHRALAFGFFMDVVFLECFCLVRFCFIFKNPNNPIG